METLSTFRNAVNFLRQFPEFVFVHNEALLYGWVEEYEPQLFEDIREFVRQGRWVVVGAWYLQPDCNMPGGESFVRQVLYGKRYFRTRFGVDSAVGFNMDPFGHNGGLPQILAKSGYAHYVHFRPQQSEKPIDSDIYTWRGVDGSEILCCRPHLGFYCTEYDQTSAKANDGIASVKELNRDVMAFWGLGDHGGGPTFKDLVELRQIAESSEEVDVVHSHPEAFFERAIQQATNIPVVEGDLQRSFPGCYTSAARLKRAHRSSEGLLAQSERLAVLAHFFGAVDYPSEELDEAWRSLLFTEFHDILPGSSIREGNDDALETLGHCAAIARKIRLRSTLALAALDPPQDAGIPIYVFNPHSFSYSGPVEADFMAAYRPDFTGGRTDLTIRDRNGAFVASQEETAQSRLGYDWRKKIVFWADVPPMGWMRYLAVKSDTRRDDHTATVAEDGSHLDVSTGPLRCRFDKNTGVMISAMDTPTERELLAGPGFVPLVVQDDGDSWGTGISAYRDVVGQFAADPDRTAKAAGIYDKDVRVPSVRVVENGPIRTVVETILHYADSQVVQWFVFYSGRRFFEVRLRVLWNEPHRMLKLALPTTLKNAGVRCEIPYGAIERAADGTEHTCQRWVLLEEDDYALGIVNTGQYGFDVLDGEFRQSLLRSPVFCHEKSLQLEPDRAHNFMDMGEHEITLNVVFGEREQCHRDTIRFAEQANVSAVVIPYFPTGPGNPPSVASGAVETSFLSVNPDTVVLGALKQSEIGEGCTFRLHETLGRRTTASVQVAGLAENIEVDMGPFALRTFRLTYTKDGCRMVETNLMEEARDLSPSHMRMASPDTELANSAKE